MSTDASKSVAFFQIDAFADRPFSGNPAAVCVLPAWPDDRWMQQVAAEMNLSETAFLVHRDSQDGYELRWFTPAIEVALLDRAQHQAFGLECGRGHRFSFRGRSGVIADRRANGDSMRVMPEGG